MQNVIGPKVFKKVASLSLALTIGSVAHALSLPSPPARVIIQNPDQPLTEGGKMPESYTVNLSFNGNAQGVLLRRALNRLALNADHQVSVVSSQVHYSYSRIKESLSSTLYEVKACKLKDTMFCRSVLKTKDYQEAYAVAQKINSQIPMVERAGIQKSESPVVVQLVDVISFKTVTRALSAEEILQIPDESKFGGFGLQAHIKAIAVQKCVSISNSPEFRSLGLGLERVFPLKKVQSAMDTNGNSKLLLVATVQCLLPSGLVKNPAPIDITE